MRKIIKLLSALIITTPLSSTMYACGGTPQAEDPSGQDVAALLKMVNDKINSWFGEFSTDGKNVLRPSTFPPDGEQLLKKISDIDSASGEQPVSEENSKKFFEFIVNNISDFGERLQKDSDVGKLFSNIDANKILTLNLNSSDTNIIKTKFVGWKEKDYFYDGYDPEQLKITDWNVLRCNLKFTLIWRDFSGIEQANEPTTVYDINFVNESANIADALNGTIKKIQDKLKNFIAKPQLDLSWNIGKWWQSAELNTTILNQIKAELKDLDPKNELSFTGYQLPRKNGASVSQENGYGFKEMAEAMFLNKSSSDVKSFFTTKAKSYATTFNRTVNSWKPVLTDDEKKKVSLIGMYELNNWSFKGLVLPQTIIPTAIFDTVSQDERINSTATTLASFFSKDGIWGSRLTMSKFEGEYSIKMNKSDFQNYTTTGKTFIDTVTYLQDKTISLLDFTTSKDSLKMFNAHDNRQEGQSWNKTPLKDKLVGNQVAWKSIPTGTIDPWMYFNGYVFSLAYSFIGYTVIEGANDNVWSK